MSRPISPRTVLEAFLPFNGEAPLAEIYATANLAGIPDQTLRLAIRRLVASGDATQMGRGRAGTLTLTRNGRLRLERDRRSLSLAFAQDAGRAPWDGRWRLIAVSIPERERSLRDTLRRELTELGAAAISTSLYASPHDLAAEITDAAGRYVSTATTDDLNVAGTTDPKVIAETLWPSRGTIDAYATLDDSLDRDAADTSTPAVVRMLILADALELAIRHDPLLPPELRSAPWTPSNVRAAWAARWEALSEQASNETAVRVFPDFQET